MLNAQDERSTTLNNKKAIVIEKDRYQEIVNYYKDACSESVDWFTQNYEDDFIKDLANYLSISSDTVKPWDDANDYFMPSTNINVEVYTARMMETIRGGRDFLTLFPRGKEDFKKIKPIQLYLRYTFETPMDGYSKILNSIRAKNIFGTSIMHMPWALDIRKRKIDGTYIFDKSAGEEGEWIKEIHEETGLSGNETPSPKDFSFLSEKSLKQIVKSNKNYVIKDLYEDVIIKDCPDLEVLDLFNVRVDPNGGNDIQKHRYTIIETTLTLDEVRRRAANGTFDKEQVDKFINSLPKDENGKPISLVNNDVGSNSYQLRDNIEGISKSPTKRGVRTQICYGSHEIDKDMFEEETVGIILNGEHLVSFIRTPFMLNGVTFRPLIVDRFIELPHRFYGLGQARILEQLNFLLNHLINQILNHGDLHNSPPLIYPQEGQWSPEYSVFAPGQAWASDNSDGFKILNTPDIKPSQVQMIQFVEGFIQKTLGISDFTLGNSSSSIVSNDTAHGMANILRETNRRLDFYSQNTHETTLKKMFEMILWESQLFMEEAIIPKITDLSKEELSQEYGFDSITNENIQGLYDVKIYANSLTASREYDQVKWQNLLQILSQVADPQTGKPVYDAKALGDSVLEANGEPFPSVYHYVPAPEKTAVTGNEGNPQDTKPANPEGAISKLKGNDENQNRLGNI